MGLKLTVSSIFSEGNQPRIFLSDFDDFYVDSYRFWSSESDGILSFSINQVFRSKTQVSIEIPSISISEVTCYFEIPSISIEILGFETKTQVLQSKYQVLQSKYQVFRKYVTIVFHIHVFFFNQHLSSGFINQHLHWAISPQHRTCNFF